MKLNQKGFGAVMWILVVVVLIGMAAGGYYIFTQNSDEETNASQEESTDEGENALAQNQRDTNRKNHVAKMQAALATYAANNNGQYPEFEDLSGDFYTGYLDSDFDDPLSGEVYEFVTSDEPELGQMRYEVGFICEDLESGSSEFGGARTISVQTLLESGDLYCQDNR